MFALYQLKAIMEAMMTRDVLIQNLDTNTEDLCFDDSALISDSHNFEFMKLGGIYNCKIGLLGEFMEIFEDKVIEISINRENVIIGNTQFAEVVSNNDIYYISNTKLKGRNNAEKHLFKVARKNLIQVNDVIHEDFT